MNHRVYRLFTLPLFAALGYAQGTTSRAAGVVSDSTGATVPGAKVSLINEGTNQTFTASTATNGAYFFEAVQSGRYTVTVEASGFKKFTSRGNSVTIGQPMTVNATLEVGAVAESVEVAGTYEAVQTSTSGNFGSLLSGDLIRDLPIVGTRGRNPLTLVNRMPGVVSGANTGGEVHVHGARDRAWNFTLDGVDSNDTSSGGSNFSPLRQNPDSLAEFRVITSNATAEFGRSSGGQVAMVTRSGTNELHGSVFWFYRTPRLHANEWESNINNVGKRQFVQHIPGFSVGGPIRKNRTFYFANIQWLRARESAVQTRRVLTESARQGVYRYVRGVRNQPFGVAGASVDASGNVLPGLNIGTYNIATSDPDRRGLDARVRETIGRTPLPNNFTVGDGLNVAAFVFPALQQERQHDVVFKVDHSINDRNTVFARVAFGEQKTNCDRGNGGTPYFPGTICAVDTSRLPRNHAFNWRTTPNASMTNELVFGINDFTFDFYSTTPSTEKVTMIAPLSLQMPEDFSFGNLRQLTTYQFVDNFAVFKNAHALKFGANLRFQRHRDTRGSIAGLNANQQVNFSRAINTVDPARFALPADVQQANDRVDLESLINFMLGRVGATQKAFVSNGNAFASGLYNVKSKYNENDFYFQDTWKVKKNLTVDLGLRWEIRSTPSANVGMRAPDQAVALGAGPSNTLRWTQKPLYSSNYTNFGPSIGAAWDPFGKGKTSLRANYRLANDRINTFVFSSSVLQNLPGIAIGLVNEEFGSSGGRLANLPALNAPTTSPAALAQPAAYSANSITVVDPNFKNPVTHGWGLSIQHEVFNRTVVEINYIGRRAYHLFGAYNQNQAEIFSNGFVDGFRTVAAGGESPVINTLLGVDSRRTGTESGSAFMRRQFATEIRNGDVGALALALATRTQNGRTLSDLAGLGPFFFVPYPQFARGMNVIDANDFSTYHGLEFQIERRMSNGVAAQLSYTLSKSLDTRSFDPTFTVVGTGGGQSASSTPFDLRNRKLNYALSDFDRTHVVQSYVMWELPFGKGRKFGSGASGIVDKLVGGWQVSGFWTIAAGRPFTIYSGFNNLSSVVQGTVNCNGCTRKDGGVHEFQGLKWYLTPDERARFQASTTAHAGTYGNTGRNFFRGPGSFSMDGVFMKRFYWGEKRNVEVRADASNLTNTPTFGFPTAIQTSATFGRIRDTVISGSRKFQLGAKINF